MPSVRVVKAPLGLTPYAMRCQLIGVEIPILDPEKIRDVPLSGFAVSSINKGNHVVFREKAVEALRKAGRTKAANFWSERLFGPYLVFGRDICEEVNGD